MRKSECFPSKYLKAMEDVPDGEQVTAVIDHVKTESMSQETDERRPVIYFRGFVKGLVCNVTNWNTIEDAYGDESDDWTGKTVVMYATEVQFRDKMVPAIRVKIPKAPKAPAVAQAASVPPAASPNPASPAHAAQAGAMQLAWNKFKAATADASNDDRATRWKTAVASYFPGMEVKNINHDQWTGFAEAIDRQDPAALGTPIQDNDIPF